MTSPIGRPWLSASSHKPAIFRGPLAAHQVPEPIAFAAQVGYQRRSAEEAFFKELSPDDFVTRFARVRAIHALTIEEARSDFKQQVIDNRDDRDDREIFVIVSW